MLKQPWEEVVMDGQFFSASLLNIDEESSNHLSKGLDHFLRLAIPLGVTAGCMSQHGSRSSPLFGNSPEEIGQCRQLVHPNLQIAIMPHLPQVTEDLLDRLFSTRTIGNASRFAISAKFLLD